MEGMCSQMVIDLRVGKMATVVRACAAVAVGSLARPQTDVFCPPPRRIGRQRGICCTKRTFVFASKSFATWTAVAHFRHTPWRNVYHLQMRGNLFGSLCLRSSNGEASGPTILGFQRAQHALPNGPPHMPRISQRPTFMAF